MKLRIPLILLTVSLFFLTGCYTQLQHSQRITRITEEPRNTDTYTRSGEEENEPQAQAGETYYYEDDNYEEGYEEGYYDGTEDAFYYKDYKAFEWYARHGFRGFHHNYFPHRYGFPYRSYYSSFYNPYYDYYPGTFTSFSLSFHFGHSFGAFYGHPFRWHRYRTLHYWDPYYGYGYNPVFVNNYIFSGYAGYVGVNKSKDKDRTYGRRTIGTNRVGSGASGGSSGNVRTSRTSEVKDKGRSNTTRLKTRDSKSTTRTRGTVRTRSGSDNTRVRSTGRSSRSGNGNSSSGTTRRTRGSDSNRSGASSDNTRNRQQSYSGSQNDTPVDRERIRKRLRNSRTSQWGTKRDVKKVLDMSRSDRSSNRIRIDLGSNRNSSNIKSRSRSSNNSSSSSSTKVRTKSSSSSSSSRGNVSSSSSRSSSRGSSSSSSGSSDRRSRGN